METIFKKRALFVPRHTSSVLYEIKIMTQCLKMASEFWLGQNTHFCIFSWIWEGSQMLTAVDKKWGPFSKKGLYLSPGIHQLYCMKSKLWLNVSRWPLNFDWPKIPIFCIFHEYLKNKHIKTYKIWLFWHNLLSTHGNTSFYQKKFERNPLIQTFYLSRTVPP